MSEWAAAKYKEYSDEYEGEEGPGEVKGICKLNQGDTSEIMSGKAISYELRGKKVPGSAQKFTGVVQVPEGMESGIIHTNIAGYFNGDCSAMRALRSQEKEDESWGILMTAMEDGQVKREQMMEECYSRLQTGRKFLPEEVKELVKAKAKKSLVQDKKSDPKLVKASSTGTSKGANVEKDGQEGTSRFGVEKYFGVEKNKKAVAAAAVGGGASDKKAVAAAAVGGGASANVDGKSEDVLVWQVIQEDGTLGRQYAFNAETQKQMKDILLDNPNVPASQFYMECGVQFLPFLHKENALLREKIDELEKKVTVAERNLVEMTQDRNDRARDAMKRGDLDIKEVSVARAKMEAAEATAQGLREHNDTLKEELRQAREIIDFVELKKDVKAIQISSKKTEVEVTKNSVSIERFVNMIGKGGEDKNRKVKMFTTAAEKLQESEEDWIIITRGNFFRKASQYRSLAKDLDNLARMDKLERMVLVGDGSAMASDLHKKKLVHEGWDGKTVIILLDGAELVKDREVPPVFKENLASVGKIISLAFEDTNPKRVIIVAGPAAEKETEEARMIIVGKMLEGLPTANTLNMSEMARKKGVENMEMWSKEGEMTPLAAATLMSRLVWLAANEKERSGNVEEPTDLCQECGFFHEGKPCLKAELADIKEKVDRKDEEKESKDEDRNKNEDRNRNRKPQCQNCTKFHYGECYAKKNFRDEASVSNYRGSQKSSKFQKFE